MKLIKPSFSIIEQQAGLEGVHKQIERVGRVSHKSEDRITENSAKTFVERMMKMKHLSTCEFGTVYLKIDNSNDIVLVPAVRVSKSIKIKIKTKSKFVNKESLKEVDDRMVIINNFLDDVEGK